MAQLADANQMFGDESGACSAARPVAGSPETSRDELPDRGVVDGRYRILRTIGAGGTSVVYDAQQIFTGQSVALKMLLPEYQHTAEGRERLLGEALILGGFKHPNIVAIIDAGVGKEGMPFIALEKLEGRSLESLLQVRRTFEVGEALHVTRAIALAVAASHRQKFLHRDLKPANVIVVHAGPNTSEQIRLIDFGIATRIVEDTRPRLTAAGALIGTPEYLAPEQLMGEPATIASEIYALGLMLFEFLTGALPFTGNYAQRLMQISAGEAKDVRALRPEVSPAIAALVARALSRDPARRFGSAEAFASAVGTLSETSETLNLLRGVPPPLPSAATRRHARAAFVAPISAAVDGHVFEARAEDISVGGLLCFLQRHVSVGTHVALRFTSPVGGHAITALGLVRWARKADRSARLPIAAGIEFLHLPDAARAEIEAYVKAVATK